MQPGTLLMKKIISTPNAPRAIGTYSQAVRAGGAVYLSGQIPLVPETMELVSDDFEQQARQVFENLRAVARAAGGELSDAVKLTIYMLDLSEFPKVNEVMASYFSEPYPARATIGAAALPKGALLEIDAILALE